MIIMVHICGAVKTRIEIDSWASQWATHSSHALRGFLWANFSHFFGQITSLPVFSVKLDHIHSLTSKHALETL